MCPENRSSAVCGGSAACSVVRCAFRLVKTLLCSCPRDAVGSLCFPFLSSSLLRQSDFAFATARFSGYEKVNSLIDNG